MTGGTGTTAAGPVLRPYRDSDRADLYDVCVRTADNGGDARGKYDTDRLMGDLFAMPYAVLEPHLAFVLEDAAHVVGYVVGTADTIAFAAAWRARWIPALEDVYTPTDGPPATDTDSMLSLHFNPELMIVPALADYPAHLHIDLLPQYQRRGFGRSMMDTMLAALHAAGAPAVYVAMLTANVPARAFYDRLGFHELDVPDPGVLTYLGRSTSAA
ncbi:MAG: hypothetical protein QOG49_1876 [Frankiaceae bacterium]|nr:hypothetical protein [Frankiaceae bacterium]